MLLTGYSAEFHPAIQSSKTPGLAVWLPTCHCPIDSILLRDKTDANRWVVQKCSSERCVIACLAAYSMRGSQHGFFAEHAREFAGNESGTSSSSSSGTSGAASDGRDGGRGEPFL